MRRTRHFALPVKAWQYIGLLIVSLACLTLGLVSRDKEGRAGSLAGPELEHQAPHEVDACPNSYFFTKMPYSILDDDQTRVRKTSVAEPGTGRASSSPDSPRISRSRSLDRSSEARLRSRRDSRIERRLSVDRREDRVTLASRISERRERSADRFDDTRDRRSHSTERRESILDRETSREDRRQVRERRARSLDRRESNFERVNRNRDREDRRRSLVNRQDRRAEDRRSLARDLRQVRTASDEDRRRNTRSVLDENRNSVAGRNHLDSRSRTFGRASSYSRINGQFSRSLDRRISMNDLPERKLTTTRLTNVDERRETNTLNSSERSMDRQTSDSRRGRIDRSLGRIDSRDRLRLATRRASKSDLDRRFTVERQEESNGRRERMARSDRRLESRSNERRESLARSLEKSKVDNLERRERTDRVSRNRVARSPETVKRDLDQRARDLSVDRRSERRTLLDSRRSAERQSSNDANRKEIRTERSRINDLERRERLNRVNVDRQARESRERVARTSERDLDRRTRDLSSDRRSERRVSVESRSLERRERQEIRNDRSRINNLERREEPRRVVLAGRVRNDVSRTPEASKRVLERRVRDLSADRRSERRTTVESRTLERQEIRNDRSRINNLERREEPRRVVLAGRVKTDVTRTPEASKRVLERRVRDLSADRRSERRATADIRTLNNPERQEIRNDRSRINNLERREEPRRVMVAGRVRTDVSRTPEASKRVLERRVRDLSADRRSERRATAEIRTLNNPERKEISNDRSRINNLERREEPRRVVLAGRVRTDVSRTPEASKRVLERRVRDLSADRRSERRTTAEIRTLNNPERQEIRNDRSRINNLERREEPRRVALAGRVKTDMTRTPEASKRVLERRVRDLSADRRSERRATAEIRTLNNPERQEIRNDRSRINNLERREEPRRVVLAGRVRTDVSRTPEASKRVLERRVRDLSADRRSERRTTVESRTLERRERQEIRNDRSRINNLERREEPRRVVLAGRVRTDVSRTPEASKRVLERRVRDLSADRRSERRTTVESRTLERRERQEIRNDRSRINNLERREEPRRVVLADRVKTDMSRTPEASKRVLERRVRDLSADRRSERRTTVESRTLERRERQEIRNDRSRINNLERREEPKRVVLADRVKTDMSRTPEASKRVLERRVRDLSADRRSERKETVESRTLERRERQEIRNGRSRINNLERREESRRVVLAGRVRTDVSRTPEASKRVLERRFRDVSADRRLDQRATVESRTLERRERQEIRNDRSRINNLERREEPRRVVLAGRVRTDVSRTPEASKRVLERRVRDLSADRRSERRATVESRPLERRERQEIRNARSRINSLERQDESRRLTSARRVKTDLSRTPEASNRLLEQRVRDLSADRQSERKATVESRTLERRERQEIRNIRSRINNLERREESRRMTLAGRVRTDASRTSEATDRNLERRVRDLSADRRSERKATVESKTLERRERQEIRNIRSRINNFERQDESRRLTLARDLSRTPEASKRGLEIRDSTQRSERRVRSTSSERKLAETNKRRVIRIDGRSERRALLDHARISRSNSANREEIRTDRRLLERSTLTLERSNRLNLARESRSLLSRTPEASNRDLERRAKDLSAERRSDRQGLNAGRLIRSSMDVNRQETLDRSLDSGRFLRQKMDVSRLQRSNDHTNDIQRRQRLIATRRLLNDVRQSRLVELSDSRGSRKDSMDSVREIKSSRDDRISDFDEASSRLKISVLQRDSMKNNITLEIVRQAIVIGLCAVYGLSILRGKQSFISNLARHSSRLILW